MYFMPASFASCTQASASNFTGFHCVASCSYSVTGIRARNMIHSPIPGIALPLPLARRDGVQAPVDEEAELGLVEPGEPRLLRLGRFRWRRLRARCRDGG